MPTALAVCMAHSHLIGALKTPACCSDEIHVQEPPVSKSTPVVRRGRNARELTESARLPEPETPRSGRAGNDEVRLGFLPPERGIMVARIRKAMTEREEGFTLIELLVVIIIIGILAAIAIPVFLNQRQKGYDAQAKSDARNLATLEETYMTDYNQYWTGDAVANASVLGFKKSSNVTTATIEGLKSDGTVDSSTNPTAGYCIAVTSSSGNTWAYNSVAGGLQAKGVACP